VDILKQLKSFNQPIIVRRVQNDAGAASPLCKHQGTLVRLHLLDQLGSVSAKGGNRLYILLSYSRFQNHPLGYTKAKSQQRSLAI